MINKGTVLVTGSSGFIGRATVEKLQQAGWLVIKGVRPGGQKQSNECVALDLTNPVGILDLVNKMHVDAIVHLGAHVGWSGATESEMYCPNVLASGCVAFLAREWNANLIYASAAIVCGSQSERIGSDSPVAPDLPYAYTKWLGELLVMASQVRHCIFRIGGVFGRFGPSHLGLNRAIKGALNGEMPFQIGMGRALRNYVYVKDVAAAITYALENNLEGTHLLAGTEIISVNQMLKDICARFFPGQRPIVQAGPEAMSQIIEPSPLLPKTRRFHEALIDIAGSC